MAAKAISPTRILHQCIICDAGFYPKRTDRTDCCSRECGFIWSQHLRRARIHGRRAVFTITKVNCLHCSKRFTSRNAVSLCSEECRGRYHREQSRKYSQTKASYKKLRCLRCGSAFHRDYGTKTRFCSIKCKEASAAASKRRTRKRRKAMERGATVAGMVDPIRVLERDAWRCQLCGKRTPKSKRGSYDDNAPELDHIVPLSKGGQHTYANTQCLCRACNLVKSDQVIGQLHMFCEPVA